MNDISWAGYGSLRQDAELKPGWSVKRYFVLCALALTSVTLNMGCGEPSAPSPAPTAAPDIAQPPTTTPLPLPSPSSAPVRTSTPSPIPTARVTTKLITTPTLEPTATPTLEPTATPTPEPTATPTPVPTATLKPEPKATPTVVPTPTPAMPEVVGPEPSSRVAAFYYPWYANPYVDGRWFHWGEKHSEVFATI